MMALFQAHLSDCILIAGLTLLESAIRVSLPICLIFLLQSLENDPQYSSISFAWATALSILGIGLTIAHHVLFLFSMRLGWNWKSACTALIHKSVFHMSGSALNDKVNAQGTGMMVNLISNDVARLEEFSVV
jgi:hypothetical protein